MRVQEGGLGVVGDLERWVLEGGGCGYLRGLLAKRF